MQDIFYTKRLACRKITKHDLKTISAWSHSQEAYGDYLTMEKISYEDTLIKLKNHTLWNDNTKTYLIERKKDGLPIGTIKYWTKAENQKTAMIAIKIAIPEHRKKGYGTEAQKALTRELFKKYNFETIEMFTDINNIPQQKCLKILDFENMRMDAYEDAGSNRQGYLYILTKERYEKSAVHIYYYD